MKRFKFCGLLAGFVMVMGSTLPVGAQVTNVELVTVPSGNLAGGSVDSPVMGLQVVGSDTLQTFQIFNTGSNQALQQGLPTDILSVELWTSTASTFSINQAVPVTVIPNEQPDQWSNGGAPFALPVADGEYLFVTANIATTVQGMNPGRTIQMSIQANSTENYPLVFGSGYTFPVYPDAVTVSNAETLVAPVVVSAITSTNAPTTFVQPGTSNVPVMEFSVSTSGGGTALLQTIQVNNLGTATTSDITAVNVWYQSGGGSFNASTAVDLGSLSIANTTSWSNAGAPFDWNINNGDGLYVTVNTSTAGTGTCLFTIPSGEIAFSGTNYNNGIANVGTQVIGLPTPTATFISTNTPTITPIPPTSTDTPTNTPIPPSPTNTPLAPTNTPTHTPVVIPTLTNTPVPTNVPTLVPTIPSTTLGSVTVTPTPNVALYLDNNSFNPTTNPSLGMDVRVDEAGVVKIIVFNIAGQEVRKILDANLGVGNTRAYWDGRNNGGALVGNGLYFVLIQTPSTKLIRKVIVLK